ncbi:MAG: OPT family oligopeptide transporter [Phycisphaerae bacterium]
MENSATATMLRCDKCSMDVSNEHAVSGSCPHCGGPLNGTTPAVEEDFELPVQGFVGTPDEIERQWYEKCYIGRGDRMLQLTFRAVVMGSALGAVLSLTNIYIGLKAGWGFGVAITACILSYAIWTSLHRIGIVRTPMTILENNCMQSTASSAGYSTGGTLISAFAAYMLITNKTMPVLDLIAWVFCLAVLGVTMAVPMKRQMINIEQLRFPSGIAAAETLRALHSHGEKGMRSAKALGIFGLLAAISQFWKEGLGLLGSAWERFSIDTLVGGANNATIGAAWTGRTVAFTWDPIFLAAGAITGMRVCVSMMIGAVTCWLIYVPTIQRLGIVEGDGYRALVQWTLWGGTACMVTSGLLTFALQWRSAISAFQGLFQIFSARREGQRGAMDAIETPMSWFLIGQVLSLIALAYLAHRNFQMPYWETALAVVLSFALSLVACRVTGETDTTPVGSMGKITQLTFAAVSPGNMIVNLMSANVTAAAASSSADLLTDLKSGYLLGAHPRRQFIAQFLGIFAGSIATVLAFNVIVPNASVLGSDQFPAPAAQTWRGVAEALADISKLHPLKIWGMAVGGTVGLILPILSMALPKYRNWIPSAAGIGLAWTFHFYTALNFMLGAIIAWAWQKTDKKGSDEFLFPVASGVIAGGSLMGVLIILIQNGPEMVRKFLSAFSASGS